MKKSRHQKRMERWAALNGVDAALGVSGVIGKALVMPGLIAVAVGLVAGPVIVAAAGAVIAAGGFTVWWYAAREIGRHVGQSTAGAMGSIWLVPTWSFLGDLLDLFGSL